MCGISGIIRFVGAIDEKRLTTMNKCMTHRGPDSRGNWVSPDRRVGLSHNRLSIIDLSAKGNQPMSDATGETWIVFNGEIYNYIELRDELQKAGVKFRSGTDTEVIIHLYRKHGDSFVQKLRGMFAFCLIDLKKQCAILARDRVGKKPIIYTYDEKNKEFVFASDISAVVEGMQSKREIDLDALNHFLTHVYFHVPAPYTIFKHVRKLEPASMITIDLRTAKMTNTKYWQPEYGKESDASFEELKEHYLQETREAVQLRERSDVPVGVLLSGGLDSSTIVALIREHNQKNNIHTFAIGYDKNDPELLRARKVAKQFQTTHHEYLFEETGLKYLSKLIAHAGEPFNVPSALYALQLSEKIQKEKIKVVMNGAGADEMFCGYSHHNQLWLLSNIMKAKRFGARRFFALFDSEQPKNKLAQFIRLMSIPDSKTKGELYRLHNQEIKNKLYTAAFVSGITQPDVGKLIDNSFNSTKSDDTFKKHFYSDLSLANAHSMTYTADITGMACSIEIRSPFLDHKLLEFAGTVPTKYKLRSYFSPDQNKYIMKKAAEEFLPKDIIYGKKMGFGYNIKIHELTRGPLKEEIRKRLFNGTLAASGLFNMDYVQQLFDEHISGKAGNGIMLMHLVCFEEWYRQFMVKK